MYLLWLRVATVLYGLASVSAFAAVFGQSSRWRRICVPIALLGWFFHAISSTEMLGLAHRWMPVGMHEVQSTLALLIATVFLLIAWRYRTLSFGIFALPLAFLLTVVPALGPDKYTFRSPEIRSGWIFLHITALLAAYAALIFSLIASLLYLVQERRLKNKRSPGFLEWLPPLDTMDQIAQITLVIGFYGMTIGLLAGSLIAQESFGASYFADPKIWFSFLVWGLYVAMLFVRRSTGLRGRRAVYLSSLVFLGMLSVWAANIFSSVHRFSAP
ncbi:MAG TPA: cytochrome c biogenesis protein CcsA [Silvibacterium sp.]|nr:cytochrome c biogenesis protein CcsA [Silvibacterium sp.]